MTTMVTDDVQTLEARHVLQTYRRQPVTLVRGERRPAVRRGRARVPGLCSRASAWPRSATRTRAWRSAIAEQAQTLLHTSNLFFHPLQGQLAERLAHLSGLPRAFFCNSGTEAVEACLKFARRYWYTRGETRTGDRRARGIVPRPHVRLAVGRPSDEHYRAPFAPLLAGVRFVPANDAGGAARPRSRGARRPSSPSRSRARAACARSRRRSPRRSTRPARRPARSSSPTKCRAASAAPGYPFYFGAHRAQAASRRRSARRSEAACRSAPPSSARRSRQRSRSATTAARTAATCWPAVRRSASSTSWSAAA